MDLGACFLPMAERPVDISVHSCLLPGAHVPLVLPLAGLPPADLRSWILQSSDSPLAARLRAAFALDAQAAWTLLDARPPGSRLDLASELLVARWLAEALALFPEVDPADTFAVLPAGDRDLASAGRRAFGSVQDSFAGLGRLPWRGPLLLLTDDQVLELELEPGGLRVRPVLPLTRMPEQLPEGWTAADTAADLITRVYLQRLRRGGPAWPEWLTHGLVGVAQERLRGRGPSPRGMWRQRRAAGLPRLLQVLRGESEADTALATAMVAPLVHTRQRHRLPSFLDLLRNGLTPVQALAAAYDLEPQDLIARP